MSQPLVSVIVPTRNSAEFLSACLQSIRAQTYPHVELIVVDRDSTDTTKQIATSFGGAVFNHVPERCAQRNFGVAQATGQYVAILDSDMQLAPKVIEACVAAMESPDQPVGVIIPEQSFGVGFWAKCKALERSFYVGNDDIEAARFFTRSVYNQVGGYNEDLVAGEDWDLDRRVRKLGAVTRIQELIHHNEGHLQLGRTLKKKFYYAQKAKAYFASSAAPAKVTGGSGPFARYKLFFSRPAKLFNHPMTGLGMLFMKTCEYAAGALGYFFGKSPKSAEVGN